MPPDLSICTFVLEQSLSVRALQEMLANTEEKAEGVSVMMDTHYSKHKQARERRGGVNALEGYFTKSHFQETFIFPAVKCSLKGAFTKGQVHDLRCSWFNSLQVCLLQIPSTISKLIFIRHIQLLCILSLMAYSYLLYSFQSIALGLLLRHIKHSF